MNQVKRIQSTFINSDHMHDKYVILTNIEKMNDKKTLEP